MLDAMYVTWLFLKSPSFSACLKVVQEQVDLPLLLRVTCIFPAPLACRMNSHTHSSAAYAFTSGRCFRRRQEIQDRYD
jgi:hypothetical protein